MTKARTAAQKRRDKAARRITLAGGESVAQPVQQGARNDIDRDPARTAREARMRQGLTRDQAEDRMGGCAIGRRLLLDHVSDRQQLWDAVQHMRWVAAAYDRAIGAPKRHAKCLSILAPASGIGTGADAPPPDLRNDDQRSREAVSAWMRLQGWLGHTDSKARSACIRHVLDEPDEPITDWTGIVLALRCISDGLKGEQIKARVRRLF